MTLVRIVSGLCVSHQSMLGRPVIPAALNTCVGLISSNSAATASRFWIRELARKTSTPFSVLFYESKNMISGGHFKD